MSLSREAIFQVSDLKTETVEVPEWGGQVTVRGLTAFQKATFDSSHDFDSEGKITPASAATYAVRLVCLCACADDGSPLFQPGDFAELQKKSGAAVQRVADACRRVNGGEAEKNSAATT